MEFEIGMKVVYEDGYGRTRITHIEAITPKGFIRLHYCPTRLFNPNGTERTSNTWHRSRIYPATQDHLDLAEKSRLARRATDFNWRLLSLEQLREIDSLITATLEHEAANAAPMEAPK